MKIAIGADHRGREAASLVSQALTGNGHAVEFHAPDEGQSTDYPEPAFRVGRAVADERAERGVLICGTGIGMSIAANKIKGVRAAVVHDEFTAQLSRSHNNANVLCLSADLLAGRLIEKIVDVWIDTPFDGGRHERRVAKIGAIELGNDPTVDLS